MAKSIRIKAHRDGFRRCGIAHRNVEIDYPAERWSDDELARLQAEPMLMVEIIDDEPNNPEENALGDGSTGDGAEGDDRTASPNGEPVEQEKPKKPAKRAETTQE